MYSPESNPDDRFLFFCKGARHSNYLFELCVFYGWLFLLANDRQSSRRVAVGRVSERQAQAVLRLPIYNPFAYKISQSAPMAFKY